TPKSHRVDDEALTDRDAEDAPPHFINDPTRPIACCDRPPSPRGGSAPMPRLAALRCRLPGLAEIRQDRVEGAEALDGVLVGDGGRDDDVVALLPVGGRRHLVPGG